MSIRSVVAAMLLIAGATPANSSCSPKVSDTSTGGGQEGPPETWCSHKYGVISTSTDHAGPKDVSSCMAGEICAQNGSQSYECCDPDQMQYCAYSAVPFHDGSDHSLYCAPWGWERLRITKGGGTICTETETCALRKGDCLKHVCCDPREDPKCGVPNATCFAP